MAFSGWVDKVGSSTGLMGAKTRRGILIPKGTEGMRAGCVGKLRALRW